VFGLNACSLALHFSITFNYAINLFEVSEDKLEKKQDKADSSSTPKDSQSIPAFCNANGDKSANSALAFGLLRNPLSLLAIHQAYFSLPA